MNLELIEHYTTLALRAAADLNGCDAEITTELPNAGTQESTTKANYTSRTESRPNVKQINIDAARILRGRGLKCRVEGNGIVTIG